MFQILSSASSVDEMETFRQSHNPKVVCVRIGDAATLYLDEPDARRLVGALQAELAREVDYQKCAECGYHGGIHTRECSRHVYNRIRNGESVD